ncbi:unnamed protein product [Lampetra planeri]
MAAQRVVAVVMAVTVVVAVVVADKAASEPSDEEIVNKCGFSLQAIHECQMRLCMEAKTECEAPLNKDLSGAEVCEGDGFDRSDLDCLILHRKSMAELTDCKAQGYLKVKRECFNRVWSDIVRTQAEALLKRPHVSDDLVECALNSCFNNTECFHNYHHELAQNPECDHRNCTLDIAACKHLDTANMSVESAGRVSLHGAERGPSVGGAHAGPSLFKTTLAAAVVQGCGERNSRSRSCCSSFSPTDFTLKAALDIRCFPCTSSDNITEKHGFRSNLTELHTSRSNLTEHCTFRSNLTELHTSRSNLTECCTFRSNLTEHHTSRRKLELG